MELARRLRVIRTVQLCRANAGINKALQVTSRMVALIWKLQVRVIYLGVWSNI
jgi:hypothetical protein